YPAGRRRGIELWTPGVDYEGQSSANVRDSLAEGRTVARAATRGDVYNARRRRGGFGAARSRQPGRPAAVAGGGERRARSHRRGTAPPPLPLPSFPHLIQYHRRPSHPRQGPNISLWSPHMKYAACLALTLTLWSPPMKSAARPAEDKPLPGNYEHLKNLEPL